MPLHLASRRERHAYDCVGLGSSKSQGGKHGTRTWYAYGVYLSPKAYPSARSSWSMKTESSAGATSRPSASIPAPTIISTSSEPVTAAWHGPQLW